MGNSRHHKRRRTKCKRRTCTQKVAFRSELAAMRVGARYGQDWYRAPTAMRGTSRARTASRGRFMDNEERTRRQLAKHAQRMRRIGCTLGEIARALEITIHETKRLLKEAAQ